MSCNENEKIFCCIKFHQISSVIDETTGQLHNITEIHPVFCRLVCPEDCLPLSQTPSSDPYYTYEVVESCNDCKNNTCNSNCAILFNSETCLLQEYLVNSLDEVNSLINNNVHLAAYIECMPILLSKSAPNTYEELLQRFKNKYCKSSLNSDINDPKKCSVCCINNNCYNICDVKAEDIHFYIKNVLNINIETSGLFSNMTGIIKAQTICETLQGWFKGYNTNCNTHNSCAKTNNLTT